MAIKGWTDVERLPRLGQIALGVKDERGIPKAVDYFVVPPEVQEVYGSKPTELDILIPSEDIEHFFPAHLKRYGEQFGLICRGNGEIARIPVDYAVKFGAEYGIAAQDGKFLHKETGEILQTSFSKSGREWINYPCDYKNCKFYGAKRCTEVAILNVILLKVPGILGVYSLDTGSFNSYTNIKNSLGILKGLFGKVSFIPLKLKVRMQRMNPFVGGKRIKTTVPVLYIDMGDLNFEQVLQMAKSKLPPTAMALPDPIDYVELEPLDEDQKPELLYPVADNEDNQRKYDDDLEDEADMSVFMALTPPQIKPTQRGVYTVVRAACVKGPLAEGEVCEVWTSADDTVTMAAVIPHQEFTALVEDVKDNRILASAITVAAKESA